MECDVLYLHSCLGPLEGFINKTLTSKEEGVVFFLFFFPGDPISVVLVSQLAQLFSFYL